MIEDLASQALGKVCDPDPGERWWDAYGGLGQHALHLGALMDNKGTVITTFDHEKRRHEAAVRLRRGKFRNIAAKVWDGRHPPGKPGSFDGVLVERAVFIGWVMATTSRGALDRQERRFVEVRSRPGKASSTRPAPRSVPEGHSFTRSQPSPCVKP